MQAGLLSCRYIIRIIAGEARSMIAKSLVFTAVLVLGLSLVRVQGPALVDVGGYKLDVVRAGSGGPPVVLVAGLGDDVGVWNSVTTSIGEFSTVVAYSR